MSQSQVYLSINILQRAGSTLPVQGTAIHLVSFHSEATGNDLVDFPFGPEINTANMQGYYKGNCAVNQLHRRVAGLFGLSELHLFHLSMEMLHTGRLTWNKGISGKPKSLGISRSNIDNLIDLYYSGK